MFADLREDRIFTMFASALHDAAISSCLFRSQTPTLDGFDIHSVGIEFGFRLTVRFQLYFFTATLGHSVSPAEYSLSRGASGEAHTATYGCGLRNELGDFWYPRTDKYNGRNDPFPCESRDWAFFVSRHYGDTSLRRIVDGRKHRQYPNKKRMKQ